MGLISALVTLPLAPVKATVWLAERIQEQAESELYDESAIRAALLELEEAREMGVLGEEELTDAENVLIERLMQSRGYGQEGSDGAIG
jgi:hypothetical protein